MKPIKLPRDLDVAGFLGSSNDYGLIDTRFFPISFVMWKNDPTEELIHKYYDWRLKASKHASEHNGLHLVVKDLTEWGVPRPTIRQLVGEYAQRDAEESGFGWRFLIVPNAIMRGAVTAVAWIKGENSGYTFVKDIPSAISAARKMYDKRGFDWVDGLSEDTYRFPNDDLERQRKRMV